VGRHHDQVGTVAVRVTDRELGRVAECRYRVDGQRGELLHRSGVEPGLQVAQDFVHVDGDGPAGITVAGEPER
jgi:hypothetical protein